MRIFLILLLLLFTHAPDPGLSARWDTKDSATITWTQTQRGCLSVEHATSERVFISCYERFPATIRVELGHQGPLSGDLRPMAGDVYVLRTQGQTYRAPLRGRLVYFPVFRG